MSITIAPNSWPGFGGLYYGRPAPMDIELDLDYIINNVFYIAYTLDEDIEGRNLNNMTLISPFNVDPNGSQILLIDFLNTFMFYQRLSNGRFVELLPRREQPLSRSIHLYIRYTVT